jgi:hypothetical protein
MDHIIHKLFDLHINTEPFPFGKPNKQNMDEEWEIYAFLYENLPEEYKKTFLKYIELRGARQNEDIKSAYEQGFKTAIRLLTEALTASE